MKVLADSFNLLMVSIILAQTSEMTSHVLLTAYVCVCSPGLSLSVAYRLNQMSSGSLQTELALAQNPLEVCSVFCVFNSLVCFCLVHDLECLFLSTPTNTHVLFSVRPLSLLLHYHRMHSVIHTLSVLYTKL